MTPFRILLVGLVLSLLWLSGCGWKGDKEVELEHGDSIGKGPGLFTGKRGGAVIYQR